MKRCMKITCSKFIAYIIWYRKYFGEDTRYWFMSVVIREMIEILFQTFALYYYNGLNVLNPSELVLGYKENEIKLFAILLSLNCIIIGVLWVFYIFAHNLCHGLFFKQIVVIVDSMFDTFYALYPIILVTNQTGFNLNVAVGVLQINSLYVMHFILILPPHASW